MMPKVEPPFSRRTVVTAGVTARFLRSKGEKDDDEEREGVIKLDLWPVSATRRRGLIRRTAVTRSAEIPGWLHFGTVALFTVLPLSYA